MTLLAVALVKLPKSLFEALPRAGAQPDDGAVHVVVDGVAASLRLLDDGALVATDVAFGGDGDAVLDRLWHLLGDAFADHDDDRGVFVVPSSVRPRGGSYDAVLAEVGEAGEWVSLDDEDEGDGAVTGAVEDAGGDDEDDGIGPGPDFMSAMASITQSLGMDTLMQLQQAMMSGDPNAFARAQEALAQKIAQRPELARQLEGLVGMMPPEMLQAATTATPESIMRQAQSTAAKGRK